LFGYEKDNPSYEFLKTGIFLERSDKHSTSEQTIYTHNLSLAKRFFAECLSNLDHAKLEKIYARVTQQLLFNIYTISDDIDVCVAFETMNNRGKPLSHLELLKNRLIFLSTKFKVNQQEKTKLRSVVNECWKAAYHFLGKNEQRPLNDDDFLATHFFVHFGPKLLHDNDGEKMGRTIWAYQRGDHYKDYLLESVFNSRSLAETQKPESSVLSVDSLYEYAQNLKSSVQVYYSLYNPSEGSFSDDEKVSLERLRRLGMEGFTVLLVALYLKEGHVTARAQILKLLERIMFFCSITRQFMAPDELNPVAIGVELSSGRSSIDEITNKLKTYIDQALQKNRFTSVFAEWAKRYGYYGWKGIRYFMFEYEQELLGKSKTKRAKLDWDEFAEENYEEDYKTVEHIYPQKVVDECWKNSFARYSVKERNILKNSIGNLVPLSKSKNSALSNKCFSEKKGDAGNTVGYAYGCYSEIEVSQATDWTPKEILARGIRLLEFMERRWQFPLGSTQDKVKALGLQFVDNRENQS